LNFRFAITCIILIFNLFFCFSSVKAELPIRLEKYIYYVVDEGLAKANIDKLKEIWERASKAGYTKVVLKDSRFNRLSLQSPEYFQNVKRVKKIAKALNLEIIPVVFPIGYSNDLLCDHPDLAECLPVRNAPYIVKSGIAHLIQSAYPEIEGGDQIKIRKDLKVIPFRQYHLFLRIKTKDYKGSPFVWILAGDDFKRSLNAVDPSVEQTQDWKEYHFIFNSLNYSRIRLILNSGWRIWGGTLWWGNVHLEEVGFINLIRRGGAPLEIRSDDGRLLKEGKDFEPLHDLGLNDPSVHFAYHVPPVLKVNLPDGARLKVSYYHAITNIPGQIMICPTEKKTVELLKKVFKEVNTLWQAKSYFMDFDEIRILGWDQPWGSRQITAGQILAHSLKTCTGIIRESCPECTIYVWNDMFDPFHNAIKDNYYLVKDDLRGSWEGLDKNVVVSNWNSHDPGDSLKFFAENGNRQIIAGYYDEFPGKLDLWLKQLKENHQSVIGIMYTTWENKYGDLEGFSKAVDGWLHAHN
jgi:hypothetical protein